MTETTTSSTRRGRFPLGTFVVTGVAAVGLLLGSLVGPAASTTPRTEAVEVVGAYAVCPDLRQETGQLATRVSVGAAPLPEGRSAAAGSVVAVPVSGTASEPVGIGTPGQVATGIGSGLDRQGLVVTATGALAAGLEVEQVTRGESGSERGLAGLRCEAPRSDWWFLGGWTTVGHASTLVLVNIDDTPATVDVTAFGSRGDIDSRPGQGITVQPRSRQLIALDTIAPDALLLGLRVQSRRGRVAAAVRHTRIEAGVPRGVEWVPPTLAPATEQVVPGIPQGPGTRVLAIGNPGLDDTVVKVAVTTTDGQFVPTGLDQVTVRARSTVAVDLGAVTEGSAVGAVVTSLGTPVLASALVVDQQTGSVVQEFAYTAASLPLSGPALLTDLVIDRPTESTLLLTAPREAATVLVTPIEVLGAKGKLPAAKTVTVPAGRTALLKLSTFFPPFTEAKLAVEVRPLEGSGDVYAARYLRQRGARGPLTTLLDLQGPAQAVSRPDVARDPMVGAGR